MIDIVTALVNVASNIKDWVNIKLTDKVDIIDGKGLSTNDLTDELVLQINDSNKSIEDIKKVVGKIPTDSEADTVIEYTNEKFNEAKQHANTLNTNMDDRIKLIEDDYLDSTDKTDLQDQITENENAILNVNTRIDNSKLMTSVHLPVANWVGDTKLYSQVVTIEGVSATSKIDLQPTPEQLIELQDIECSLMAVNDNGIITVYALHFKPEVDYTMNAIISEVAII
jgi:hypothetical protein